MKLQFTLLYEKPGFCGKDSPGKWRHGKKRFDYMYMVIVNPHCTILLERNLTAEDLTSSLTASGVEDTIVTPLVKSYSENKEILTDVIRRSTVQVEPVPLLDLTSFFLSRAVSASTIVAIIALRF